MILTTQPTGVEALVTGPSTFGNASLVRVYNVNGSDVLITLTRLVDSSTPSFTIKAGSVEYVLKAPGDTLTFATSCRAVAVSQ